MSACPPVWAFCAEQLRGQRRTVCIAVRVLGGPGRGQGVLQAKARGWARRACWMHTLTEKTQRGGGGRGSWPVAAPAQRACTAAAELAPWTLAQPGQDASARTTCLPVLPLQCPAVPAPPHHHTAASLAVNSSRIAKPCVVVNTPPHHAWCPAVIRLVHHTYGTYCTAPPTATRHTAHPSPRGATAPCRVVVAGAQTSAFLSELAFSLPACPPACSCCLPARAASALLLVQAWHTCSLACRPTGLPSVTDLPLTPPASCACLR